MKLKATACILALLALATASSQAAVETYTIDAVHSSVGFKVRHILTPLPGGFTNFEGTVVVDRDNLENSSVTATIQVASVDTANERRDNHLRSGDFFLAESFPTMTFKSTSWKKTGDDSFDVTGDLTIRDVTKPVTLKTKLYGFADGGRGTQVSAWEATTTLDRLAFGVEGGRPAVGDEVTVVITIEARMPKS
jgi:polyisoprenoid-binding protein YceI